MGGKLCTIGVKVTTLKKKKKKMSDHRKKVRMVILLSLYTNKHNYVCTHIHVFLNLYLYVFSMCIFFSIAINLISYIN